MRPCSRTRPSHCGPELSELTPERARALFERRRAAWLAGDLAGYLALWSDELVIHLPGRAEPIRGKAAYGRLVAGSFAQLRPVSWEFHRIALDGDHVLAEWTIAGEVQKSGKLVRWRGMSICRIADGLIQEWREYWDPAVFAQPRAASASSSGSPSL